MYTVYGMNGLEALALGLGAVTLFVLTFAVIRTRATMFRIVVACAMVALVASVLLNVQFVRMAVDSDLRLWPVIDRCVACGEHVYAWESYEQRGRKIGMTTSTKKALPYGLRPVHVHPVAGFYHAQCPERLAVDGDEIHIEVHE